MKLDGEPVGGFGQIMDAGEETHEAFYNREVQSHATDLRSWLHRRFSGLKDPENVVQEALTRVWRRIAGQRFEGSSRALLFVTARNLATDEMRRNQIIQMEAVAEWDSLPVYTGDPNAADLAAKKQELELLTLAIQSLPSRCRQVLTLRKIYGLSQKEIAAEMGISEHTVEAQVANGMRRCADFLKKYGLP